MPEANIGLEAEEFKVILARFCPNKNLKRSVEDALSMMPGRLGYRFSTSVIASHENTTPQVLAY